MNTHKAWLRILAAKARTIKLKDPKSIGGKNLVMVSVASEAIIKFSAISHPRQ